MRTMKHNSRTNASGKVHGTKHNDRNFDVTLSDNIDPTRVHLNEYWHVYQNEDEGMTFEAAELRFYKEHFTAQLDEINQNYRNNRHPERCKDMAAWKQVRQNAPEETTLQIGKMEEHVDGEILMACFLEYNRRLEAWNEDHGRPFTQLSYARHEDEAVPHVQTRRVWHYAAEDGSLRLGQEKALEQAGVALPNPGEKVGRRNNRKMTFDAMARQMWLDVIHEHGIDVERVALPDGKHNRDKEDMIRDKYDAMEKAAAQARQEAQKAIHKAEAAEVRASALEVQLRASEAALDEQRQRYARNDAIIQDQEEALGLIQTVEQYQDEALDLLDTIDTAETFVTNELPAAARLFKASAADVFMRNLGALFDKLRQFVATGIQRLRIYERTHVVAEPLSEPVQKRADSLADTIARAFARAMVKTPSEGRQSRQESLEK